jgi:DNA polymerase type B, organellar and viral
MPPEFIAVDGEADDQGRYIILCDSTGRALVNPDGIGTRQALEWLVQLGGAGVRRQVVCFGLNYDVNQWLRDLNRFELQRVAVEGGCSWRLRWKLKWWPAKYFQITDRKTRTTVKVCEVFGFFQTSFVKALEQWGLHAPAELQLMKRRRGTFTQHELDRVVAYCQSECRLLVQLMNRLAEACENAGCAPRRDWIGAGAIASSLLHSKGVKAHHVYDADLAPRETVEELILGAYYGGRVELLTLGEFPAIQTRDVRSAYPHAAAQLPSLIGAKTVKRKRADLSLEWAIWRVRWQGQAHGQLAPFPVRQRDGSIIYPESGEGAYHAIEVRTAIELGYDVQILEGVQLKPAHPGQPFEWIPAVYQHRARLKARGDAAEKALKLGLNSVYGKLAQGYGHGPPPFQSYWWAGHITAATRARMLALAHRSRGVVMISTDGLFAVAPGVRGSSRPTLGSWEPDSVSEFFAAQPGVYHGLRDGRPLVKSRGFFAKDVDYDQLRQVWREDGPDGVYHYASRRFIGARVALHRNRLDLWRQWVEEQRAITLEPTRKIWTDSGISSSGTVSLFPPPGPIASRPYTPKQSLYDDPQDRDLENMIGDDQPHYTGAPE